MDRADLELVLAIRDGGSLSAAAAALGLAPPAVSKRLAALERLLGQRLFHRSTRRVSPTNEGELLCHHAARVLDGFVAAEEALRERQQQPAGPLRIAASLGFGRRWVGPTLLELRRLHPGLTVDLHLGEQLPDLAGGGFDGAVWLAAAPPQRAGQWVARRLASNQRVLVATQAAMGVAAGVLSLASALIDDQALHVASIFAMLFVMGCARSFNGPSRASLLPEIVRPEDFHNAVTWNSGIFQIMLGAFGAMALVSLLENLLGVVLMVG